MTVSEFQSLYLSEQPFLWFALAAALGVLVGVFIGRWLERSRGDKRAGSIEVREAVGAADSDLSDPGEEAASADVGFKEQTLEAQDATGVASSEFQISHLVGMVDKNVKALSSHGITSVAELREATSSKKTRESLADELQLEDFVVNKWARMADLLSLDNMTPEMAEFLVYAGINSSKDLATRNPESVAHKLQNLNEKESRIDATPTRQQLEAWVDSFSRD